jgi:hypothetical protein
MICSQFTPEPEGRSAGPAAADAAALAAIGRLAAEDYLTFLFSFRHARI